MTVRLVKLAVALVTAAIVVIAIVAGTVGDVGGLGLMPHVSVAVLAALAIRIALWLAYRPTPAQADDALPTLTVVVPAYNEGPGVERTLASILASNYPPERLHVIAVNDGSKDDTGPSLDRARLALGDRLTVIHLPKNRGKRGALFEGFTHAATRTEIFATVDSDSIVEPDTLRNLVAPFADPTCGGVAGKVLAWNRTKNLLTRMLHVRYVLGFDFVRAYQSELGTVWCCPGAIQAYRAALVAPHLRAWRDQRFLGAPCTNGDDHAMTNLVLSLGSDTRYQSTAVVHTLVPERYVKLCRMYIRWARSATREGFRALAFTPRRALAKGPLRGAAIVVDAVAQPLAVITRCVGVFGGAWLAFASPLWLLRSVFVATLFALPYALVFLRSERSSDVLLGVLYGWFALFGLFWIQPFATLTVRRSGWMTRG